MLNTPHGSMSNRQSKPQDLPRHERTELKRSVKTAVTDNYALATADNGCTRKAHSRTANMRCFSDAAVNRCLTTVSAVVIWTAVE